MNESLKEIKETVLSAVEASLAAQLKAVRKLRKSPKSAHRTREKKRMSQADMAYNILKDAGSPLHISEIIQRIEQRFGLHVDRESIVSALSKRILRNDRFRRTARNTFALLEEQ